MKYVVVIPSYQRADILNEKTLMMLKEGGVPKNRIHIFVANNEEKSDYEAAIPKSMYHKIIVGVKGINQQRAFISKYFPEKTHIVSIDDDVADMLEIKGGKFLPTHNLHSFFEKAFNDLSKMKLKLWGVFPTPNPFYAEPQQPVTTKLRFIIATLYGYVNRHKMVLDSPIEEKEDVENTIKHFLKDGGVLRYNHVSFKTKFKNPKGGLGAHKDRLIANQKAAEWLHKTYPKLTRIKVRKNGMHEIVLVAPRTSKPV